MQKISTPLNKTDLKNNKKNAELTGPSDVTIDNILKFASVYRAQKIDKNQYIDLILN